MTYATELAKSGQRVEYVVLIEGMGWFADESDYSAGLVGDWFCTVDQLGTIESLLGGSMHRGLRVKSSIEETLDPRDLTYSVGGVSFEIIDLDGFLLANFSPHRSHDSTELESALNYVDTTIQLSDGTDFDEGDIAVIGGRECVLLGAKSSDGGTVYSYTDSTRNYLGTPRGRLDIAARGADQLTWKAGVSALSVMKFWRNKRVVLCAHVPGEADTNLQPLWWGSLRNVKVQSFGNTWEIQTVGDPTMGLDIERKIPLLRVETNHWATASGEWVTWIDRADEIPERGYQNFRRDLRLAPVTPEGASQDQAGYSAIATSYQYRTEPGGTEGVLATAYEPTESIQAYDSTDHTDVNFSMLVVAGSIVRIIKRTPGNAYDRVHTEITENDIGQWNLAPFEDGAPCRILLDNYSDFYELSRFVVNKRVTRHPIDVMLMFLTTLPGELWRGDATGGTSTVPTFASVGPDDLFAGRALFCVEGTNKGESRIITANDATSITVERAFTNAPSAGTEYQVRNTVYDVLPLQWGMGLDLSKIDVESFETVRDEYLGQARLGKFALGNQDSINLWSLVNEKIARPYGVFLYVNRLTGKLTAGYVNDAITDGVLETYTAISQSEQFTHGELNWNIGKPLGSLNLRVRATEKKLVDIVWRPGSRILGRSTGQVVGFSEANVASFDPTGGAMQTIKIKPAETEGAYVADDLETIEIDAPFNSVDDMEYLVAHWVGQVRVHAVAPPPVQVFVDVAKLTSLRIGGLAKFTHTKAINPFTGARGWVAVTARVVALRQPTQNDKHWVPITIQLLQEQRGGLIAPAANVSAVTLDGGLSKYYFTPGATDFVIDHDSDRDWYHFAVGDKIMRRQRDGTQEGTPRRIVYFGSNQSATPEGASDARVYVDGDPGGAAVAAGDYISFYDYGTSTDAENQAKYSHWADANETLSSDNDPAKVYI